jgi:hypothetical protein
VNIGRGYEDFKVNSGHEGDDFLYLYLPHSENAEEKYRAKIGAGGYYKYYDITFDLSENAFAVSEGAELPEDIPDDGGAETPETPEGIGKQEDSDDQASPPGEPGVSGGSSGGCRTVSPEWLWAVTAAAFSLYRFKRLRAKK